MLPVYSSTYKWIEWSTRCGPYGICILLWSAVILICNHHDFYKLTLIDFYKLIVKTIPGTTFLDIPPSTPMGGLNSNNLSGSAMAGIVVAVVGKTNSRLEIGNSMSKSFSLCNV